MAAQRLFAGAARSECLPRLSVGASAGYAATTFDSLSRPGTSRIIVGPVLTWPLLDFGRVKARVLDAVAETAQAISAVVERIAEQATAQGTPGDFAEQFRDAVAAEARRRLAALE